MWEHLSENSKQILTGAYIEAGKLGVSYLGSEHIMLAILTHRHNTACRELKTLGVDLAEFREKLLEKAKRQDREPAGEITFSARSARILEISLAIAISLEKKLIGTEHILLAMMKEGIGLPAVILRDCYAVTSETILEELYGIRDLESKHYSAIKEITGSGGLRKVEDKIRIVNIRKKVMEGKIEEIIHTTDYLGDLLESIDRHDLKDELDKIKNRIVQSYKGAVEQATPVSKKLTAEQENDFSDSYIETKPGFSDSDQGITVSIQISKSMLKDLIREAIGESLENKREKQGFTEED
ncbi:MAG: hypothetical protein LWY06_18500 [Firmicutes bacterium]|nr:hypothetical protein [Bacillota bacterium]